MPVRKVEANPSRYMPEPHAHRFDPEWDHLRQGLQILVPHWGFGGSTHAGNPFRPTKAAHPTDIHNYNNRITMWNIGKDVAPWQGRWGRCSLMLNGATTGAGTGSFFKVANGRLQQSFARTLSMSFLMVCDFGGSTDSNTRTLWGWSALGSLYGLDYNASTGIMRSRWNGAARSFTLPAQYRNGLVSILFTQDNATTNRAVFIQGQQMLDWGVASPTVSGDYLYDLAIGGNPTNSKESVAMRGDLYLWAAWNRAIERNETSLIKAPLWQDPFGLVRPYRPQFIEYYSKVRAFESRARPAVTHGELRARPSVTTSAEPRARSSVTTGEPTARPSVQRGKVRARDSVRHFPSKPRST